MFHCQAFIRLANPCVRLEGHMGKNRMEGVEMGFVGVTDSITTLKD